jgi:hypothetical protein
LPVVSRAERTKKTPDGSRKPPASHPFIEIVYDTVSGKAGIRSSKIIESQQAIIPISTAPGSAVNMRPRWSARRLYNGAFTDQYLTCVSCAEFSRNIMFVIANIRNLPVTRNTALFLKFGIVVLSLMAAVAVYLFARIYPPEILTPLRTTETGLVGYAALFGSAPSFFYTLALGLLLGVCASSPISARRHCVAWTVLALCLELSQHPDIAKPVSALLADISPGPLQALVDPYWSRGVFDPMDLFATLIGGAAALFLLSFVTHENYDSSIS